MRKITKYERDALKLVNKIRKAEGRKPLTKLPKGEPSGFRTCPIARALDHGKVAIAAVIELPTERVSAYQKAGLKVRVVWDDLASMTLPSVFGRFISWFDKQEDIEARALAK